MYLRHVHVNTTIKRRRTRASSWNVGKVSSYQVKLLSKSCPQGEWRGLEHLVEMLARYQVKLSRKRAFHHFHVHRSNREISTLIKKLLFIIRWFCRVRVVHVLFPVHEPLYVYLSSDTFWSLCVCKGQNHTPHNIYKCLAYFCYSWKITSNSIMIMSITVRPSNVCLRVTIVVKRVRD